MNRVLLTIIGILVLAGGLGLREFLVREEINITQSQIRTQIDEMVDSSASVERMNQLSNSSFVFEKFIEPVFEATNRLLWPSARFQNLMDWTRSLHQEINKAVDTKKIAMKTQYDLEVKSLREINPPSVDRMIKVLKKTEDLSPEQSSSEIATLEMKALKEFGQKKDDATLSAVKDQGLKRLQQLRAMLKKANHKNMGEYLSSGKFVKEIQEPAIELILTIRQEEIRKLAWSEFRTKLSEILSRRSVQISNSERLKKAKEIEKLFDEPMAQVFEQEDHPLMPAAPSPSAIAPQEQDLYNTPEPVNPSDAALPTIE